MVSIVGIIRCIQLDHDKVIDIVDDHSGRMEGHLYDIENIPKVQLNTYARVFGSIKSHGGRNILQIFNVRPLSSINELTTHLLEVVNARFMAEAIGKSNEEINASDNDNATMLGGGDGGGGSRAGFFGFSKFVYEPQPQMKH